MRAIPACPRISTADLDYRAHITLCRGSRIGRVQRPSCATENNAHERERTVGQFFSTIITNT
jgi:hypothetical protein